MLLELADHEGSGHHVHVDAAGWSTLLAEPRVLVLVADGGVGERLMAALASYAAEDGLTVTWGLQSDNHGARRFYLRLGATLHDKTVAAWRPHEYAALLHR